MSRITTLPLQRSVTIRVAVDNLLLHIQSKDTTGTPSNLTGYTFRGAVKATKELNAPKICDVQFDNTLATGIIKAYLDEDDAGLCFDAVGDGGVVYVDIVRKSAAGWDEVLAEIVGTVEDITTPEVSA